MYIRANAFLKQRGEKSKEDVLSGVGSNDAGKERPTIEDWALLHWASDIMSRYGALSLGWDRLP